MRNESSVFLQQPQNTNSLKMFPVLPVRIYSQGRTGLKPLPERCGQAQVRRRVLGTFRVLYSLPTLTKGFLCFYYLV